MTPTRQGHRRHFRSVLWFVALVVAGHLALGIFVDQSPPEVRDPEYAAKRDRLAKLLEEHPGRPWTLYLGSSRGAQGFAPHMLAPARLAFNFAVPGGGPMLQRVIYERLRSEGFKPAHLLLEVMPVFFNDELGDRVEMRLLDTARLSVQELKRVEESSANVYSRYRRWALARAVPEWRHAREIRDRIGLDVYRPHARPEAPEDAIEFDGWQPVRDPYYREKPDELNRLAHTQYDRFYPRFTPAPGSTFQLRQLIEQAQDDGVEVTLVVMPEAKHFRDLASDQHREEFGKLLASFRDEFKIPLIDARDWIPDAEFFDGHHLFPEGGERFTSRLKQELP